MRLVTDALLCTSPNILEHDPNNIGVELKVDNMLSLKTIVERDYNVPITSQHYWAYIPRINKTMRPSQYIRTNDFRLLDTTILFLCEKKGAISSDDILILMKKFDSGNMCLEHVGSTLVTGGRTNLSQLKEAYLQMLGKGNNLAANDIDCYEIIDNLKVEKITYDESVMSYYEIECGDCICFQKSCQTPSFFDIHILYSNNFLQMAAKICSAQDLFVTSHTRGLYNNKEMSDVIIRVQDSDVKFYLNKCVLSCVPYFKVMLFGSMKESNQTEVVLQDISVKGLESLLKYIYKVPDWCPRDDMQTLLDMLLLIGDMYGVDDKLKVEIEMIISSKLTPDNVLSVLFAAVKISAPRLKEKCINLIEHHIGAVSFFEPWLKNAVSPELVLSELTPIANFT